MSALRTLTGIWKSREETGEKAKSPELKTRYYKERKDRLMDIIQRVVRNKLPKWNIVHISENRGEITIEKKQGMGVNDIVVTVFYITPVRTAVDVSSAKRGSFGDLGASYRNILEFYEALHTEIQPED